MRLPSFLPLAAVPFALALASPALGADPAPEAGAASDGRQRVVAEPWSDADPGYEPRRYALYDFGFRAGAEYRAQLVYVNPISLTTETDRNISWIDNRLRLDATADWRDKVKIVLSADVLDGVLWGDNGDLGKDPQPNAGTNVTVKNPNLARPCIGLRDGDPLQPSSYGYTLCSAPPLTVRKAYAEVTLPFGLLRVGRQSVNVGTGIQVADGDGRPNRFGVSRTGGIVDRILFATKPLEALKPPARRSLSANEGLILALAYDRWVTDSPQLFADDVHQFDSAVLFLAPKFSFGSDLRLSASYAYRWDGQYGTKMNSINLRAMSRFGPIYTGFDVAINVGKTREIAQAYALITNDKPVAQKVQQVGARAVVRFDQPLFSLYLEGDYASGDPDPQVSTPLTQFTFSEDTNVGLLLFKQVLAFQSARSSAAAVEVLRRLGATTFPAEAVNTRGGFTDAVAIFPQVDVHPHKDVLLRGGAMVAWASSPLVDPVQSLLRRDGHNIQDDLVNFAGGKPGRFYGVELDGRAQYRFMDHFAFDLEGAILFPGDALRNEDGYAVRSVLVQGRTTFFF